jgi:haloalkane dehalogenase
MVDLAAYRSLYPWQGQFFEVGPGVRMHYLDEGHGEPMVMLHGNPTWSFYFRHLIGAFSPTHRVIAPDHVGCGLSDKPSDEAYSYILDRRVDDLDALLARLNVSKNVTLVVHDWGGMIGLAWAMRRFSAVKRLVVLNTAGFGLPKGRALPWQIGLIRYAPFFPIPVRAFNAFSRGANALCSTAPDRMTPLVKSAYLAPYDSWAHRIAVQRFVEDIPLSPKDRSWNTVEAVSQWLPQLAQTPTLVLWGRRDFVFNDAFLEEWRRRVPTAEFHVFEDAGHYVLEDAHERIVPLMKAFFARTRAST